jgi:dipeptidyl aminopeptidase/acylaminoacyl peptidase
MCAAGRRLADPRLSPDGSTLAVVAASSAGTAIVVVPSGGGMEVVLDSGASPSRRGGIDWLPDGSALAVVGAGGTLWRQPVDGSPPVVLWDRGGVAAPAVAPDGRRVACVVDGRHVAVVHTDPGGPWPERLSATPDFCADPTWSPDGAVVAWHEWDVPAMPWDDGRISWVAAGGGDVLTVATPHPAAVAQPRFGPDGRLGLLCDGTGWLTLWSGRPDGAVTPLVVDTVEHGGPTWGSGERTWVWSDDGRSVAFTRNVGGFGELCLLDVGSDTVTTLDRGVFSGLSWSGGRLAALRSGARTPDQVVVYPEPLAVEVSRRRRVSVARGPVAGFEAAVGVEPEVVEWQAETVDGVGDTVHGRLWRRPATVDGEADTTPGPLLVWVHGGPAGQHQVIFDARRSFLLARGWSILQVDPRGSTGWGRPYAQALAGGWGRLDVADTVAGIHAAAEAGWADPGRIAIMGASSAGLVVLLVLAGHPGLCAAGVDLYGVTDLHQLAESTHRFEAHYNPWLLGALPGAAATWRDRSPLTHAERIVDPLLVLYGSADPVVVPQQSERLVAALAARGAPVEHHCYDGEGHGWSRPATTADELTRIDAFLTRHVLRGRPQ